jgi:DNA-binding IclR family transcriptional regulator
LIAGHPGLVASLLHGLAVLDLFDREHPTRGVGEIARVLSLHKSSASRLAATLAAAGYLEPEGAGRYRLGAKLAALGGLVTADADLRRSALPSLREIVTRLGETAHLGVREGTEAVTVEVVDGWHTVRMHSWVGKRSPAHCSALGKVLLAALPARDLEALYGGRRLEVRTPRTIASLQRLGEELSAIRRQGYALDREELESGLCCVAAPILGPEGATVAAISVSGPPSRIRGAAVAEIAARMRAAATDIGRRLGSEVGRRS